MSSGCLCRNWTLSCVLFSAGPSWELGCVAAGCVGVSGDAARHLGRMPRSEAHGPGSEEGARPDVPRGRAPVCTVPMPGEPCSAASELGKLALAAAAIRRCVVCHCRPALAPYPRPHTAAGRHWWAGAGPAGGNTQRLRSRRGCGGAPPARHGRARLQGCRGQPERPGRAAVCPEAVRLFPSRDAAAPAGEREAHSRTWPAAWPDERRPDSDSRKLA